MPGLPTNRVSSLQATRDGAGLWRLEPDGQTLAQVPAAPGRRVRQLGYEPTLSPPMLMVLTEEGLTVLRGP